MNGLRLTPEQCSLTASRIVQDAALIERGSVISETGNLVLHKSQIEIVKLEHKLTTLPEPTPDYKNPFQPASEADLWLQSELCDLGKTHYPGNTGRAWHALQHFSITTPRDVLAIGKERLRKIAYVGKGISFVEAIVQNNFYGFDFKDWPTPEEVTDFCDNLSQVTVHALSEQVGDLTSAQAITSVQDFTYLSTAERRAHLKTDASEAEQDRILNYPEIFALRFAIAQRKKEGNKYV